MWYSDHVSSSLEDSLQAGTSLPAAAPDFAVVPQQETETEKPLDTRSGDDLLKEYAQFLRTGVQRIAYPLHFLRMDSCSACGKHEQIQGEVRLIAEGVLMRQANVGTCEQWLFETESLSPDEYRREVQIALAGEIVCGEGLETDSD